MLTHLAKSAPEQRKERALEKIGNLAKKLTAMAETSTSREAKSSQKASNSANISGALTRPDPSKKTGTGLSRAGLPAPPLDSLLSGADPKATLSTVQALLPPEIASSLKPVFGRNVTDLSITKYELKRAVGPSAIVKSVQILEQSLTPMSGNECLDLLTELKSLTRPSPGTTDDLEIQLTAYLRRCMTYPADVVRYVLTTQPEHSAWWPAWSELKERLELHTRKRKMMLEALMAA